MKICLSRTDSIGDVILSLPMVGFIKKHLPESEVLFLGKTYTRPVIKLNPYVDEFLNWDQMKDKSDSEIIAKLKKLSIDVFIHVFPNKRLAKLVKKAGISRRIGTSRRLFHWLTCNEKVSFTRKGSDLHESELNLKLLAHCLENLNILKKKLMSLH
jgi:heptosyltransferase-3